MNMKQEESIWLQITAGQGPKECGWVVAQATRRVLREAESLSLKASIVEWQAFDKQLRKQLLVELDAYRSVLLQIEGKGAGKLAGRWCGSVKWQGESLYRANHKRFNWFIGIEQLAPVSQNTVDEDRLKKEVSVETMRASGPGGQHVNKTSSAVRLTHQPTGIQVRVESDRSQHRNKELAVERMKMILAQGVKQSEKEQIHDRWVSHYQVNRGNPVRTFIGHEFREKR